MTIEHVFELFKQNENLSRKKTLLKAGAQEPVTGVPLGFLRKLAESIGTDHGLAVKLWETGHTDARFLAVMLFDPKCLTPLMVDEMIEDVRFDQLLDDFIYRAVILMKQEYKEELEKMWYHSKDDHRRRAAWALIVKKIADKKYVTKEYLDGILEVVEKELVDAKPLTQWNMNRAMCEIGWRYKDYTERCLEMGSRLGVYKDLMVSPGCTSAYAPDWINAFLRKGK